MLSLRYKFWICCSSCSNPIIRSMNSIITCNSRELQPSSDYESTSFAGYHQQCSISRKHNQVSYRRYFNEWTSDRQWMEMIIDKKKNNWPYLQVRCVTKSPANEKRSAISNRYSFHWYFTLIYRYENVNHWFLHFVNSINQWNHIEMFSRINGIHSYYE